MITLYSYPELSGVADNNGYGLKVLAFLRLVGVRLAQSLLCIGWHYQSANPGKAVGPISVVAIDFVRGVVVIQLAPSQYEPVRFDPKTLQILK